MNQIVTEKPKTSFWTKRRLLVFVISYLVGIGLGFVLVGFLPSTLQPHARAVFPYLFAVAFQSFFSELFGNDQRGELKTALLIFGIMLFGGALGILVASRL